MIKDGKLNFKIFIYEKSLILFILFFIKNWNRVEHDENELNYNWLNAPI